MVRTWNEGEQLYTVQVSPGRPKIRPGGSMTYAEAQQVLAVALSEWADHGEPEGDWMEA